MIMEYVQAITHTSNINCSILNQQKMNTKYAIVNLLTKHQYNKLIKNINRQYKNSQRLAT